MEHDEIIDFAQDEPVVDDSTTYWHVLIVDDDKDVHSATEFALNTVEIHGRKLKFSHAYSGKEAIAFCSEQDHDIAIIFMDVVMETDSAGLHAIEEIRKLSYMQNTRVILRTGQPGSAPEMETIVKYDINDYKPKSELTRMKLFAALSSAIRSYDQLEKLEEAFNKLRDMTFVDPLTGLMTRYAFVKDVDNAIHDDKESLIVLVDIDHFSNINDIFGQDYGDIVLVEVANKLRAMYPNGKIARLHKDLFAVLDTTDVLNPEELREKIKTPFTVLSKYEPTTQKLTACLGVVFLDDRENNGSSILKDAEIALEMAKESGADFVNYFTKESSERRLERVKMLHDLRTDFYANKLSVYYQPQIDLHTGKLIGAEALIRWKNKDGRFIPPDVFIPIAEQSKLINEIGEWVLKRALTDSLTIQTKMDGEFMMAVNVSIGQFSESDFISIVRKSLEEVGVKANSLELEITESVASLKLSDLQAKLNQLKAMGVCTALDDFGTGFSSLSYLDTLSLDKLKIDKSFIKNIHKEDARLVDLIIMIGVRFGMTVIAEGVETEADRDALIGMGCDQAQGYYYGRPVPLDEFLDKFVNSS